MAGTDFSHLTNDELIKGIQALKLPDYIRSKAYGIDVRETLAQMTEMTIQLGINMGLSPDEALSWARKLQYFDEELAQTEAKVTDLEKKKADNSRIDKIIVTPAKGITEQEIIDARKGKASLRAKMDNVDNTLLENKKEFEYLYNSKLPATEWYQGSNDSTTGALTPSDSRIRSGFIEVTPETDYFFRVNEGFEFWIVEFREQLTNTIISEYPIEFHTDTKRKTLSTVNYIKIIIRRTDTSVTSTNPKDKIRPEDIVLTGLQAYTRPANNLIEMSEATDEIKNVNSYVNIEETDNVIEMDVSNDRNFYVDIVDTTEKQITIRNLHKITGNMISRVLVVNALVNPIIKFPSNVAWQNNTNPHFSEGRTYMILLQSFNGGISWLGSIASSWKNKDYIVYDDFDKPDQLGLGQAKTGQVWEYSPTSVWEIIDGSARVHTFRTDGIIPDDLAFCESGESNVRISSVVEDKANSGNMRLTARISDSSNFISVGGIKLANGNGLFGIFKVENGKQTLLSDAAISEPLASGDAITVELEGTAIKAYLNGHVIVSATSSFNETATKHGMISHLTKDRLFHNFSVEVI